MKITTTVMFIIGLSSINVAEETISDMPSNLKASVEWVWKNRISPNCRLDGGRCLGDSG